MRARGERCHSRIVPVEVRTTSPKATGSPATDRRHRPRARSSHPRWHRTGAAAASRSPPRRIVVDPPDSRAQTVHDPAGLRGTAGGRGCRRWSPAATVWGSGLRRPIGVDQVSPAHRRGAGSSVAQCGIGASPSAATAGVVEVAERQHCSWILGLGARPSLAYRPGQGR